MITYVISIVMSVVSGVLLAVVKGLIEDNKKLKEQKQRLTARRHLFCDLKNNMLYYAEPAVYPTDPVLYNSMRRTGSLFRRKSKHDDAMEKKEADPQTG